LSGYFEAGRSSISARLILARSYFLTVLAPFWEESFWPGFDLMIQANRVFANCLLPKYCESKTKAEPKRNVGYVPENDFSSKILQGSYWQPSAGLLLQGRCQMTANLRFVSWFDVVIKPLRGFSYRRNAMGLAPQDADHRHNQEYDRGSPEEVSPNRAARYRSNNAEKCLNDQNTNVQSEGLGSVKADFDFAARHQKQLE
jgi:hypothetical protein